MWIHLESGFKHDQVRVRVAGREVFSSNDVTTDYSIGLAKALEMDVPPGSVEVEVLVPSRDNLRHRVDVDTRRHPFLAVSLTPDGTQVETSTAAIPPERL